MASSKEDKNAHENAPGCTQTGPCQANVVLQIGGVSDHRSVLVREEAIFLAQPLRAYPDLQGEWTSACSSRARATRGREAAFPRAGIASAIALASAEPSEEARFRPPKEASSKEPGNEVRGCFHWTLVPH